MTCVFCDIAAGSAPASIVYEDDDVIAFLDLYPAADHHVLVVPKQHAACLSDLDANAAAAMLPTASRIADAMRTIDPGVEGINLWLADGEAAGQDVGHVHLHVISRRAVDAIEVNMPVVARPNRDELDHRAEMLRGGLQG